MIQLDLIKNFFPVEIRENASFKKYMLKEYIQLLVLDFLSTTPFIRKIALIGGTNLRLVKRIDRFSEILDFDCKEFLKEEFMDMTNTVISFLKRNGFRIEARDRENKNLTAFRRSIYFPELLYELGLSGHKEERFLIKFECEDQRVNYKPVLVNIKGCGLYFPFPVPHDRVLCSMKISAMLSRQKGRDFYDTMFLLAQTQPDYFFLGEKLNIHNPDELKTMVFKTLETINLDRKKKDFEHLLFNKRSSERILYAGEFFQELN
jgi:predicted nucleotidyltransferase component of viral defense system